MAWKQKSVAALLLCCGVLWAAQAEGRKGLTATQKQLLKRSMRGTAMSRARALDRLGREKAWAARPHIRKLLTQGKLPFYVRISAILAAGRLGDRKAFATLARFAEKSRSFTTRMSAIWALAQIRHKGAVPVLVRILKQRPSRRILEYAVWALGIFRDKSSAKHLYPVLSYSFDACSAARSALRKMGMLKGKLSCSSSARRKRKKKQGK